MTGRNLETKRGGELLQGYNLTLTMGHYNGR
jgi:hypothetical protein